MSSYPETASFADFARIANFRASYIKQLKDNDRLVLTDDGKRVRVAESLQRIDDTKDPSKIGVARRHAAARAAAEQVDDVDTAATEETDPNGDVAGTQSIRRDVEAEKLRQLRRENDLAEGKLLIATDVANAVRTGVVTLRTRLESLPDTLAPQLITITDEAKARSLLAAEIEHALHELERQFGAIAREAA